MPGRAATGRARPTITPHTFKTHDTLNLPPVKSRDLYCGGPRYAGQSKAGCEKLVHGKPGRPTLAHGKRGPSKLALREPVHGKQGLGERFEANPGHGMAAHGAARYAAAARPLSLRPADHSSSTK